LVRRRKEALGPVSISTETTSRTTSTIDWPTARSFLSGFLLRRMARPEPLEVERHSLRGAVLLSDVESFTGQVERLVAQGPDGFEQVVSGFNRYFCTVGDVLRQHGGDVLQTTGDSFLCLWPAEDAGELVEATAVAAQAALAILEATRHSGPTSWLTRIGIAAGELELGIVGGLRARWQVTPGGPAVADVVKCERSATAGTALLSPEAAALLEGRAALRTAPGGRAELERVLEPASAPASADPRPQDIPYERLDPMIPAPVRRWGGADHSWLADFRRVNVVMAYLGPPEEGGLLNLEREHEVLRIFQEVVLRYDGDAEAGFDNKGVSLSSVFGLPPRAHPDNVDRALQAASEFSARLRDLGTTVTVGVSSGRVCCGVFGNDSRRQYAVFGDAINIAARLSTAGVEGVLIDEETFHAASLVLEVEGHRVLAVKNRIEPVRAHRLLAVRPAEVPERELVGREPERSTIDRALELVIEQRLGSTIVIEGELGMGKSALARYAARAARQRGAQVLRVVAGTIERATAYRPWRPLISALLKDVTSAEELAEKFGSDLRSMALLPLLNPFLPQPLPETPESQAMTGEARSEQLNALLSLGLRRVARATPSVLVVEDTQWFDSMSWALLDRITADDPECLAIVTERIGEGEVELPPERERVRSGPRTQVLTLEPLSPEDTTLLIHQRLGTSAVDPDVLALVLERVIGHPFFCEALLEMMIQNGAIQITGKGARLAPRPEPELSVPASIESAILGQFDRLPSAQQLTLKAAAVVGRTFRPEEVAAAHPAPSEADIPDQLEALREVGLLAPGPSTERYAFWHQIIQEVAYGVLTKAQRYQTHRALAQWYESLDLTAADARPELLAHHWMQGGLPRRAAPYLEVAGRGALHAGAFKEAVDLLVRAMEAEPDVSPRRRALQEKALADARYFLGDLHGSRALLEQSLERLGYPIGNGLLPRFRDLLDGIGGQAAHLALPRRYLGRRAADRAELLPAADAFRVLVQISYLHGNSSVELSSLILRGLNLAELAGSSAELSRALANASGLVALSGLHRRADRYAERAIRLVEEESNASAAAYVWNIVSIMHASRGQWEAALSDNGHALELFGEVGDTRLESELWQTRAALHLCRGSVPGAEEAWQRHRDLAEQTGSAMNLCWALLDEAQTSFLRGDVEACGQAVQRALKIPIFDSDGGTALERRTTEALARLAEGSHEEAASHARGAIDMLARSVPAGFHWAEFGALSVEVLLDVRAARSRRVPPRLLDKGIRRGLWTLRRCTMSFGALATRVPALRARAALLAGDRDAAQRMVELTRRQAVRPDQRLDRARAGLVEAELCLDPGRRAELLAEPLAVLAELGQLRTHARAHDLLR
jgi:class 3 adenylate cyclase/tetratricopeptide (TPR) repeat protein